MWHLLLFHTKCSSFGTEPDRYSIFKYYVHTHVSNYSSSLTINLIGKNYKLHWELITLNKENFSYQCILDNIYADTDMSVFSIYMLVGLYYSIPLQK